MATIAVIDDEPGLVELVELILSARGYEVWGESSPRKALERLTATPPDVVLLDLMMPEINGWELLHQLEARPQTQGLPVIFISAYPDFIPALLEWKDARVVNFLSKPFEIEHMIQVIAELATQSQTPGFRDELHRRRSAIGTVG